MGGVNWQQHAGRTHERARLAARASTLITCGAAFTIAILNPLLCLLHCAYSQHHAGLSGERESFLCDLEISSPALISEPYAAVWKSPRAVYQALLLPTLALIIVVVIVAHISPPTSGILGYTPLPEFPPPKARPRPGLS